MRTHVYIYIYIYTYICIMKLTNKHKNVLLPVLCVFGSVDQWSSRLIPLNPFTLLFQINLIQNGANLITHSLPSFLISIESLLAFGSLWLLSRTYIVCIINLYFDFSSSLFFFFAFFYFPLLLPSPQRSLHDSCITNTKLYLTYIFPFSETYK